MWGDRRRIAPLPLRRHVVLHILLHAIDVRLREAGHHHCDSSTSGSDCPEFTATSPSERLSPAKGLKRLARWKVGPSSNGLFPAET
jgi:hypothetical protein